MSHGTISRTYREIRQPTHTEQLFASLRVMMIAQSNYPNAYERHRNALIIALEHVEETVRTK